METHRMLTPPLGSIVRASSSAAPLVDGGRKQSTDGPAAVELGARNEPGWKSSHDPALVSAVGRAMFGAMITDLQASGFVTGRIDMAEWTARPGVRLMVLAAIEAVTLHERCTLCGCALEPPVLCPSCGAGETP